MMKYYFSFLILISFTLTVNAQIDSQKKSTSIPAVESKKDTSKSNVLIPSKPINNNTISGMSIPKTNTNLNLSKKEFSMFGEKFGNPGELYEKQLAKNLKSIEDGQETRDNGSTTDQYFGDFKSNAKFIRVVYRDHGYMDGDLIRVLVNDDIIHSSVYLTNSFKGFKLDLQKGFNKIDFLALNQGESGPNTAEFKVIDDLGNVISSNRWNLATGVKATIIIVKE